MRKLLLAVVASGALIALMPATALAKHGSSRHHHARVHHRFHHKRFGTDPAPTATSTTPTPVNTAPSSAATIVSFTNGLLTISTINGNVSGFVTADTQIECVSPSSPTGMEEPTGEDQSRGDDQGQGDDNQGDDDQGDDDQGEIQSCDMSNLVAGAGIQFADLAVAADGVATWDKVDVIVQPPTTTAPPTVADTDGDGD
jgi:hypothetical protein